MVPLLPQVASDPHLLQQLQGAMAAAQKLGPAPSSDSALDGLASPPPKDDQPSSSDSPARSAPASAEGAEEEGSEAAAKGAHAVEATTVAGGGSRSGWGRGGRLARELAVLSWRTLVDMLRNPSLLLMHWFIAAAIGVLLGCIYWQVRCWLAVLLMRV